MGNQTSFVNCIFVNFCLQISISNTKQKSGLCKVINLSDILENMEQSGDTSEVSIALKSIDLNSKENTENTGCFLCQKPDPVKKCSKSHSRCKGNFFCDKNCELSFHKSEKTKLIEDAGKNDAENSVEVDENQIKLAKEVEAAAKTEKAKLKKTKKKGKKDHGGSKGADKVYVKAS